MATPKAANRYPRPGERIAPFILSDILNKPAPASLRDKLGGAELKLCDLDESVWRRFPTDVNRRLAQAVVDCIATREALKVLRDRRFPRPVPGLRLDGMRLENRTRRCLSREGLDDQPERLGEYTLGQILSIRAFGPRCLLDLLTAVESARKPAAGGKTRGAIPAKLSPELNDEAEKLAALTLSRSAGREDPRFKYRMQEFHSEPGTVFELAEQLRSREYDPPDIANVLEQIRLMRATIERMPHLTLEQELIQIFASSPSKRNQEIIMGYYGWEDGQTRTLNEIGNRFGITRERVRQICAKLTRKYAKIGAILAPVMDRTLDLIHKRVPASTALLEAELVEAGITTVGLSIQAVAAGAKLLNRPVNFNIVKLDEDNSQAHGREKIKAKTKPARRKQNKVRAEKHYMAVRPEQVEAVGAIVDQAKKEVYFHGLSTVARMERIIARRYPGSTGGHLVRQTLILIDDFRWLDESSGWFTIQGISKHGLPKAIDKVLAVAGEIMAPAMRAALSRNRRLWKTPPPEKSLLEYCRSMPNVSVSGSLIRCDPKCNWKKVLTGVEAKLVGVLKKHGPLMDRGALEDLCMAEGMNRFSFHAFVSWSPVIEQFGPSLYGLVGAKATKDQVEKMLAQRRAGRTTRRVLDDHGVDRQGNVWLKYRLSKAASTYAVITIPAALKKIVRGRFQLLAPDGRVIGKLTTKDGRAWGLGAYLRGCGAKFNDQVTLTIDLGNRTATIEWEEAGVREKG